MRFRRLTENKIIELSLEEVDAFCDSIEKDPQQLTRYHVAGGTTHIGTNAFADCVSMVMVILPNSVISIGDGAFCDCKSLTTINIPARLVNIGDYAFYGCLSLTSIALPDSVTSIGDKAFGKCNSLTSITVPDSVVSIGERAFYGCNKLTIKCKEGSVADEYALREGIPVEYI